MTSAPGGLFAGFLAFSLLIITAGCGGNKPLRETIVEGERFAHRIQLPGKFPKSDRGRGEIPFDHYAFRMSASSPDLLLLTACKFDVPVESKSLLDEEICSSTAYAIDASRSYAVRAVDSVEWGQAEPIPGFFDMRDPYGLADKEFYKRPVDQRPLPIPVGNAEREGFRYRGKAYLRRGTWISVQSVGDSVDGQVLALGGVDKRKLPDPSKVFLGDPIGGGSFGTFTVDIFDTNTGRRMAAVDADCDMNVLRCMRRASLANSRWFVIALNDSLQDVSLFDFQSLQKAPIAR